MLIKDLKFIEQVDDFDRVEGGKVQTSYKIITGPNGVKAKAKAKAKGDVTYTNTSVNVRASKYAVSGAASAAGGAVHGNKIHADLKGGLQALIHNIM